MTELKELVVSGSQLILNNHIVRGSLLPKTYAELDRDVVIKGETVIEGAVYARSLLVNNGPFTVDGAVFAQREIHISSDCAEQVSFKKSVASTGTVASLSNRTRVIFEADINAASVTLRSAYIAANVFGDEVVLENCVVLGGVFASQKLSLINCMVGTFHSSSVRLGGEIMLLLPTAFSVEPITMLPGAKVRNLSLADLGSLMRGTPELPGSGWIRMDIDKEEQRTDLVDESGNVQLIRSYGVSGKVLTAGLMDFEKLQNRFLIAAGSLGAQTLRTYDIGLDQDGNAVEVTTSSIMDLLFSVLDGTKHVSELEGTISFDELTRILE